MCFSRLAYFILMAHADQLNVLTAAWVFDNFLSTIVFIDEELGTFIFPLGCDKIDLFYYKYDNCLISQIYKEYLQSTL